MILLCLWKTPKIGSVGATARDILPSSSSEEPKSPTYGGEEDWKNKNRGVAGLRINKTPSSNIPPNPNTTTQNGWSI